MNTMFKEMSELLENDRMVTFSDIGSVYFNLSNILDHCRPRTQEKKQNELIDKIFEYSELLKDIYKKIKNDPIQKTEALNLTNLHIRLAKIDNYKQILDQKDELYKLSHDLSDNANSTYDEELEELIEENVTFH